MAVASPRRSDPACRLFSGLLSVSTGRLSGRQAVSRHLQPVRLTGPGSAAPIALSPPASRRHLDTQLEFMTGGFERRVKTSPSRRSPRITTQHSGKAAYTMRRPQLSPLLLEDSSRHESRTRRWVYASVSNEFCPKIARFDFEHQRSSNTFSFLSIFVTFSWGRIAGVPRQKRPWELGLYGRAPSPLNCHLSHNTQHSRSENSVLGKPTY